ncbi:MAG: methyltransferase domain-containing protein [Saprospiraceae bacterium]|nr:methyltransferase domain-containing protein [Saprospiraceae bacterium]
MLAKLFLELTEYAFFRRLVWKPIYELLARVLPLSEWQFMNYGYTPMPDEPPLELESADELQRYPLQLYHYLASRAAVAGKEMLEVGSGRGGGAHYIAKYLKPKRMVGMDLAKNAVQFAQKNFKLPNLEYQQGNAEALPFPDASFDVVINVESCHAYGSVPNFLHEVRRVLRPGGIFLITDMRGEPGLQLLREQLNNSGLNLQEETDITRNVVLAIETEEPVKKERIRRLVPKWLVPAFEEFAGVKNSAIHRDLNSRDLIYCRWKFEKSA